MEINSSSSSNNKRVRDDFIDMEEVSSSQQQKRIRVDPLESETEIHLSEHQDESSTVVVNKQLEENLLHILDDDVVSVADDFYEMQSLDSFIRGFEEEILDAEPPDSKKPEPVTSFNGEWQPEIGFLLEASDDELGIPPSVSTSGESYATPFGSDRFNDVGYGDALALDDDLYAFASGGDFDGEYIALGGLFDDESNGLSEFSYNWDPLMDNYV